MNREFHTWDERSQWARRSGAPREQRPKSLPSPVTRRRLSDAVSDPNRTHAPASDLTPDQLRSKASPPATLARLLAGGPWSPTDLIEIVGGGWRADQPQADTLAALLRLAIQPADHVALGEIWLDAVEALSGCGPLDGEEAARLLGRWRSRAAQRAAEWRRPRAQRQKRGRRCEQPAGDLSGTAA